MFFFKQKTAYERRISDWSSDVCSSDLGASPALRRRGARNLRSRPASVPRPGKPPHPARPCARSRQTPSSGRPCPGNRKSVVSGKRVSVRVDLGGRRIIKKKIQTIDITIRHILTKRNSIRQDIIY